MRGRAQVPSGGGLRDAGEAVAGWDAERDAAIPVARPGVAPVEQALPWLRQIDEARTGPDMGSVGAELEERLCQHLALPPGSVAACANATIGLTLALQAATGGQGGYCLTPAWAPAATAQAVIAAGLTPFLVDVDRESAALTPELARSALSDAPGPVAAVLPAAPFGRAPESEPWEEFRYRTDVPVVLDAAGAFDSLDPGSFPAVVSLRAGKPLASGEGGFVASWDSALVQDVRRRANLGMGGRLEAAVLGTNGRMGEQAAAYALAGLKLWSLRRAELAAVLGYYRAALADLAAVRLPEGLGDSYVAGTCCIEAPEPVVLGAEAALAEAGVATRRWWGRGLRGHPAFQDLPGGPTPAADELARHTLGLPCWPGLTPEELALVTDAVRRAAAA